MLSDLFAEPAGRGRTKGWSKDALDSLNGKTTTDYNSESTITPLDSNDALWGADTGLVSVIIGDVYMSLDSDPEARDALGYTSVKRDDSSSLKDINDELLFTLGGRGFSSCAELPFTDEFACTENIAKTRKHRTFLMRNFVISGLVYGSWTLNNNGAADDILTADHPKRHQMNEYLPKTVTAEPEAGEKKTIAQKSGGVGLHAFDERAHPWRDHKSGLPKSWKPLWHHDDSALSAELLSNPTTWGKEYVRLSSKYQKQMELSTSSTSSSSFLEVSSDPNTAKLSAERPSLETPFNAALLYVIWPDRPRHWPKVALSSGNPSGDGEQDESEYWKPGMPESLAQEDEGVQDTLEGRKKADIWFYRRVELAGENIIRSVRRYNLWAQARREILIENGGKGSYEDGGNGGRRGGNNKYSHLNLEEAKDPLPIILTTLRVRVRSDIMEDAKALAVFKRGLLRFLLNRNGIPCVRRIEWRAEDEHQQKKLEGALMGAMKNEEL